MNAKEIKKLWYECYNEDLETEYQVFYESLKEKEKDKIEKTDNEKLANSFGLELSDFSDDGSDLDELRNIMEGN